MATKLQDQVQEFLSAAVDPNSYNPRTNSYVWIGLLWGTPIPITTILLEAILTDTHGLGEIIYIALATPLQWFFFAHPIAFGMLFGILGNIRNQKEGEVEALIGELRTLSNVDPLTGLSNRRSFTETYLKEAARCERESKPLSILLIDLDYFKKINDVHGHKVGDEVLSEMGRYLRIHSRPYDLPARWGGEEFIMMLPETNEDEAYGIADRIRLGLASGLDLSVSLSPTTSIGVSQYIGGDCLESLGEKADKALYKAKSDGRNRCVTWSAYASAIQGEGI